jgi:hypothetical protein
MIERAFWSNQRDTSSKKKLEVSGQLDPSSTINKFSFCSRFTTNITDIF